MLYVLFVVIVVAATNEDTDECPQISKNCVSNEKCRKVINSNETQQIPYPEDCHKFYKCSGGKACLLCCPKIDPNGSERLVYNPEFQVCDWPENVEKPGGKCDNVNPTPPENTTTPTESSTSPTESSTLPTEPSTPSKETKPPTTSTTSSAGPTPPGKKPKCPKKGTKRIEDDKNCTKYYQCVNGERYHRQCQHGHAFNPKIGECDVPINVPTCNLTSGVSYTSTPKYFDN